MFVSFYHVGTCHCIFSKFDSIDIRNYGLIQLAILYLGKVSLHFQNSPDKIKLFKFFIEIAYRREKNIVENKIFHCTLVLSLRK